MTSNPEIQSHSCCVMRQSQRVCGIIRRPLILMVCLLVGFSSFVFAGEQKHRLVIMSPHWEGYRIEIERGFRKWYRDKYGEDVELDWRESGGASGSLKFVLAEFKNRPAGIGIDVFFGGGLDPYLELKKNGCLESYLPGEDILGGIPMETGGIPVRDPEGYWYATAFSGFGIAGNRRVVEKLGLPRVEEWKDLADPRLATWVGAGDPRGSGSMLMIYEIILQAYGWEKGWEVITRIAGNTRNFDRNASASIKQVASGQVAYALAIDVYGLNLVGHLGRENISFHYPEKTTVITPDAIGILKGAPSPQLAHRLVDYLLSSECQGLWVYPRGSPGGPVKFDIPRMSIRPELYSQYPAGTGFLNPFQKSLPLKYDNRKGSGRRQILQALIGTCLIDLHRDLVKACRMMNLPGGDPDGSKWRAIIRPPLTESDVEKLSENGWTDPRMRNKLMAQWQADALDRYRSVYEARP